MSCPECGADERGGVACWDQLLTVLAWEQDDPELAALHFLTVATHNLQHPSKFQTSAYEGLRAAFAEHLDLGTPTAAIRSRIGRVTQGATRVLRPEAERKVVPRSWPLTVASVYAPDRRPDAAARVRAWADSVRRQLD